MKTTPFLLFFLFTPFFAKPQAVQHPLDPLSWQEHWTVLEVLREAGHLDEKTRFSMVNLAEPDKTLVKQWTPGKPFPRSAYAVVHQENNSYEALIDLGGRKVISWTKTEGIQPTFLGEEFQAMTEDVKKDSTLLAAMKRRGIEDLTFIETFGGPPGFFGTADEQGRRLAYYHFVDVRGVRNTWGRAIEGLTVVVDLQEKKILKVIDEGAVSMPKASADYDQASIGTPRKVPGPMQLSQPMGPGFKIEGHQVSWQKWRFHVRPDHRVGMIISAVTYQEGEEERPVLYQGNLSEIFVPYMDPAFAWYARNFLDAGEYTAGGLSKPLMPGTDCPNHAVYFDALIADDLGRPFEVPRMIGIFERMPGNPSWRHHNGSGEGGPEGRAARELVVRHAAVLGNYDYIFDWIFQQDGAIRVAIGATGIVEVKLVNEESSLAAQAAGGSSNGSEPPGQAADAYGHFVAPQIVAVNHSHYFNYRLDIDVDGTDNSLQLDRLQTKMLPDDHPRRSIWVANPSIAKTESEAQLNINLSRPTLWRVISNHRKNHVGHPTSYQIVPGSNTNTLLSPEDYPRRRAGFIDHHLWVTPYRPGEKYAAGDFPTLSHPGQGLPAWTKDNRPIENTDIVIWHTVGMHHYVRAEDWPVMPVHWQSFMLKPFDFFDRNPALDLPR